MKIFLLCAITWLSILSLAIYFMGLTIVYFILLALLIGIILEGELIPLGAKKLPEPQPQVAVSKEESKAA